MSTFEHVNLNEVDVAFKQPTEGEVLQFVVTKAAPTKWQNENGSGECIDMTFTVTNSESFSGKNFYTRFFPDKEGSKMSTAKRLRILRDATGVGGDTIPELCEALVSQRAEFKAPMQKQNQKPGDTREPRLEVNLWKAEPAS